ISGLLVASHRHPLGLLEPALVGIPICLAVLAALILLGPWLAPDRKPPTEDFADARAFTIEMTVRGDAIAGRTVAEAGLRNLDGVFLVEVDHDGETVAAVGPDFRLAEGDRLVFTGNVARVVDLQRTRGLVPAAHRHFEVASGGGRQFYEVVVSPESDLAGASLRRTGKRATSRSRRYRPPSRWSVIRRRISSATSSVPRSSEAMTAGCPGRRKNPIPR